MGGALERFTNWLFARPALTALALGAVSALGFPPVHAWPISILSLALLVALLQRAKSAKAVFWQAWLFGWAHLTLANNWIATAFTHQAKMPEFLGWIAVPLLCVYLAIYPALGGLAARWIGQRGGLLSFGLAFAAAWIVMEWLRSWVFTGYPWPPLGLVLLGGWETPGIAVILPWFGTYALSGIVIVLATIPAVLFERGWNWKNAGGSVAILVMMAVAMIFAGRLVTPAPDTTIRYTLVQPLIPQDEINDAGKFEEQFQRIAGLTAAGREQSRLVLWPESAIPDYLEEGYPQRYYNRTTWNADPVAARERIGSVVGPQSTLLTGVVNLDIGEVFGVSRAVTARNSVIALNGEGELTHHYAKAHLVPYGEYLPFEGVLGAIGLSRLTAGTIPYDPGPGPRSLDLAEHGRAGIQICYEIVFSGQVVDPDNRPDYIFNPSNDGWFGVWGPPQHLAQARMRAIEEGLPVLRSTTTGISAVIDANGIVRETIASGEADAVAGYIPSAKAPTLFAQLGNALPLAWAVLIALLALIAPRLLALDVARS